MKPKLFLLKPDFIDDQKGAKGQKYFCGPCTLIAGLLSYYPHLKKELDVIYVDFKRPRKVIVDLIGEENQSCPVLVVDAAKKVFFNETEDIVQYFSTHYGIGISH